MRVSSPASCISHTHTETSFIFLKLHYNSRAMLLCKWWRKSNIPMSKQILQRWCEVTLPSCKCLHQPPEYIRMHYSLLYIERRLQHCCVLLLSTTVKIQTRFSVWIRSAYSKSKTYFSIWSSCLRFAQQFHHICACSFVFPHIHSCSSSTESKAVLWATEVKTVGHLLGVCYGGR